MPALALALMSSLMLLFPGVSSAATPVLQLSKIQIAGENAADEFIELSNSGSDPIHLKEYSLRRKTSGDKSTTGSSLKTFGSNDTVPAHGHFLWTNSGSIFKDVADVTTSGSLTDNNSLALFDQNGTLLDSLTWGTGHAAPFSPTQSDNPGKNECFVREPVSLAWTLSATALPTNSHGETFDPTPPVLITNSASIRINEVLPNPTEKGDAGEFIELSNFGDTPVHLAGWTLHDASKTGKYVFPAGSVIEAGAYLLLTDADFTFSLNNNSETLTLVDEHGALVTSMSYTKTRAGVSLNYVEGKLRGSRTPTPGAPNAMNSEPSTHERVPKHGFRGLAIEMRARGRDSDGDHLKYTWNFGDGHKSYKSTTKHTYKKTGRYTITLITDDGHDQTEETFRLSIKKYAPPKLRIIQFMPNPNGRDTDHEWIEIENRTKKSVNLKNFSIATGATSKKLTNHPIRDDLLISGRSRLKLTREHALFTLGNERGRVELRAPDGTVLDGARYRFEHALADDTLLVAAPKNEVLAVLPSAAPLVKTAAAAVAGPALANADSPAAPVAPGAGLALAATDVTSLSPASIAENTPSSGEPTENPEPSNVLTAQIPTEPEATSPPQSAEISAITAAPPRTSLSTFLDHLLEDVNAALHSLWSMAEYIETKNSFPDLWRNIAINRPDRIRFGALIEGLL